MSPDDQNKQDDSARRALLEEIRRRAEEAESQRLDDEDKSRTRSDAAKRRSKPPAPFPVPPAEPPVASNKIAIEQKILVLRERLQSALERGKTEKAADLFAELSKLAPDDPGLAEIKVRLSALQEEKAKARGQTRPPAAQSRQREAASEKADREMPRKKIANMLEAANTYYQQEKYDKALQYVSEILTIDPSNVEGVNLKEEIEKARVLEEQIRLEEEERRAKEIAAGGSKRAPVEESAPSSGRPTDFWGSHIAPAKLDADYELAPEEKGPVGPPPRPLSERIIKRLGQIQVPVKPLITVTVVLVLGAAVWFTVDTIRNSVSPSRYSLLVLPPAIAGDTSLAYVADGFAEDLVAELSRVSDLRVINPATAYAFGASAAPPGQIARALGANYVLSWTMWRQQEKFDLQLVFTDTVAGKKIWSKSYVISPRELAGLRPEIARGLAGAMDIKLTTNDGGTIYRVATGSESAYDLYLRGRSLLRHGDRFAPEEAVGLFEQAIALDADFSEAFSAVAWAHMLAYETSAEMQPSHIAKAITNVQHALAMGLRTPETFRAWGLAEQFRGDFDNAIERFEQAVSVAPSDAESQRRLAIAYAARGRIDVALRAAQKSVMDDPGNIAAHTLLGQVEQLKAVHELDSRDDYKAAYAAYDQGLRLARDKSEYSSGAYADVLVYLQQPDRAMDILLDRTARMRDSFVDFYKLGRIQQAAGRPIPEWQASFVRARNGLIEHLATQPEDALAQAYLALVYTRLGAFKDAVAAIGRAQASAPGDVDVLYMASRMYALQKDKSQAIEFLSKALARRFSLGSMLDMDFFTLHSSPEFIATITR